MLQCRSACAGLMQTSSTFAKKRYFKEKIILASTITYRHVLYYNSSFYKNKQINKDNRQISSQEVCPKEM